MQPRFEHFIRERQYLRNVSPATVAWYKQRLDWLGTEHSKRRQSENSTRHISDGCILIMLLLGNRSRFTEALT